MADRSIARSSADRTGPASARRLLGALLVLAASTAGAAEPQVPPAEWLLNQVKVLSAPDTEGRGSGTPGADRAARHIAAEFQAAGLKPGGNGGPYLQSFSVPTGIRLGSVNRLSLVNPTPREFALGSDFTPLAVSADGVEEGEVVFAAYGITAPGLGWDDYAGLDARGKIVLVLGGDPRPSDPATPFRRPENYHYAERSAQDHQRARARGARHPTRHPPRGGRRGAARASRDHRDVVHRRRLPHSRGRRRAARRGGRAASGRDGRRRSGARPALVPAAPRAGPARGQPRPRAGDGGQRGRGPAGHRSRAGARGDRASAPTTTTSAWRRGLARARTRRTRSTPAPTTTPRARRAPDRRSPGRSPPPAGRRARSCSPPSRARRWASWDRTSYVHAPALPLDAHRADGEPRHGRPAARGQAVRGGRRQRYGPARARRGHAGGRARPPSSAATLRAVGPHDLLHDGETRALLLHGRPRGLPSPERHVGQGQRAGDRGGRRVRHADRRGRRRASPGRRLTSRSRRRPRPSAPGGYGAFFGIIPEFGEQRAGRRQHQRRAPGQPRRDGRDQAPATCSWSSRA